VERLQAVAHEEDCNSNGEAVVVVAAMVFVLLPKKPFSQAVCLCLSLSLSPCLFLPVLLDVKKSEVVEFPFCSL
jgi:hypothetical protein